MSLVFSDPLLSPLFAETAMRALWGAEAQIRHYVRFEAAYSRTLGAFGLVSTDSAERAALAIETAVLTVDDIGSGTATDGLPIPSLVRQMKAAAGEDSSAVHTGTTSQDVMDTALALSAQAANALLSTSVKQTLAALQALEARFGTNALTAHTRMQPALEFQAANRIAAWRNGLQDAAQSLEMAGSKVERIQLGGPVGDSRGFGEDPDGFMRALASALGLHPAEQWHSNRQAITFYAGALSQISGAMGKIGQDIALIAQSGDVRLSGGGGSSAMPHKQNPVQAELLVTLARYNSVQIGGMHQALIHEQERSGSAWALEWMILPGMACASAKALDVCAPLLNSIESIGSAR